MSEKKQEPVAMQMDVIVVNLVREGINKHRARELAEHFIKHTSTPQQKQEPVGYADKTTIKYLQEGRVKNAALVNKEEAVLDGEDADIPLYTSPPQHQWVGLTDEEIKHIEETTTCMGDESWLRNLTRNIEAKLKEKNT